MKKTDVYLCTSKDVDDESGMGWPRTFFVKFKFYKTTRDQEPYKIQKYEVTFCNLIT